MNKHIAKNANGSSTKIILNYNEILKISKISYKLREIKKHILYDT